MMTQIKQALAFLWGTVFGGSLWYINTVAPPNGWLAVAWVCVTLSVIGIGVIVLDFFLTHWKDD